jgi:MSHA biogenesis protein MshO
MSAPHLPLHPRLGHARGFTLVEAIVAIVIIGILGGIVAVFVRAPIAGYAESVARAEASDEADLALRRMARDIRLALPNSVQVNASGDTIEFLLTKTGGRYLAVEDGLATGSPLDFDDAQKKSFTVVGGLREPITTDDFIVVYNLGPGMAPADAYDLAGAQRNIARVAAGAAREATLVTLADNPFAAQDEPMPSPGHRFHVVSGAVTYRCAQEGTQLVLRRHAGYAFKPGTPGLPTGGSSAVLARRVASCANLFRYDAADVELRRSALVILSLALHTRSASDPDAGSVRLVHQVHIDNTP